MSGWSTRRICLPLTCACELLASRSGQVGAPGHKKPPASKNEARETGPLHACLVKRVRRDAVSMIAYCMYWENRFRLKIVGVDI